MDLYQYIWQDSELRFDNYIADLKARKGEKFVDVLNYVEDTKGNNGHYGTLIVTNLRLIWLSNSNSSVNFSIGFKSFVLVKTKMKLKGRSEALNVFVKFKSVRYEFIFCSMSANPSRMFGTVINISRAYNTSFMYREVRLRATLVENDRLKLLQNEEMCQYVDGVWNLASDQGCLGSFHLTNIRVVWQAHLNASFNISVPYIKMSAIMIRNSNFGKVLVIITPPSAGNYKLGFRLDSEELLTGVHNQIKSFHETFVKNPIFGINFRKYSTVDALFQQEIKSVIKTDSTIKPQQITSATTGSKNPYEIGGVDSEFDIEFNPQLQLMCDKLDENMSISTLWNIFPDKK